ncbi:MAG TPA: penicillin acylase family protein, partial [Bacteroidales bacterium]|nr:penicillin acylase family protein [Bacteroidales bacterium]
MKTLKTILIVLAVILAIALITGLTIVSGIKKGALPVYNGELVIKGLEQEVTVYRDERGMPHIYAAGEHDLYLATGYIMAQERMWQMDLIRRATTGRLSELFGDDYIETDHFLRSLDMTAKSKMVLSSQEPEVTACLQAFADGVNNYISDAGKKLPPEFKILGYKPDEWKLEDIANIIGYMGWDLASGNLSTDIFIYKLVKELGHEKAGQLIPDWEAVSSVVFPEFRLEDEILKQAQSFIYSLDKLKALGINSFSGSNNWAVSGSKTTTGKPVFSNDMHLGLSSPGIWMQMHQVVPGKINITGVVIPGEPFVVAGHNEKVAWGMTNLMVDDIDLFAEKINPENEDQYFFNGEWRNMMIRKEVIKSKTGRVDTLLLKFTHRGPIVSGFRGINDAVLTMRWSGYDQSDELLAVYSMNRATDWESFRKGVGYFKSISQNFAYADVNGNIGLVTGGGIPVRKGFGSTIRSGETDEFDWKGYVPVEQLPFSYNPESGFISSANNKTVGSEYPYYISFRFYVPYRIDRIRQMIGEKEILGIDDFRRMITDQHSGYAALLTPFILKLKDRINELEPLESQAFKTLQDWDYDMGGNKIAPTVFEFFTRNFARNLLGDELNELFSQLPGPIRDYYIFRILKNGGDQWVDDIKTTTVENLDDIVLRSFKDGIKELSGSYGNDITAWQWETIHKISLTHPLGTVKILD